MLNSMPLLQHALANFVFIGGNVVGIIAFLVFIELAHSLLCAFVLWKLPENPLPITSLGIQSIRNAKGSTPEAFRAILLALLFIVAISFFL